MIARDCHAALRYGFVIAIFPVIAACGTNQNQAPQSAPLPTTSLAQPTNNAEFTIRWTSPTPQLMTPDGTFIRAFEESETIGELGGGSKSTYPGFSSANRGAINPGAFNTDLQLGAPAAYFGLGGLEELSDGRTRATICYWDSGTQGRWYFLYYHRAGTPPPANQSGSARRPSDNVFGDWYATGEESAPPDSGAAEQCQHTAPANPSKAGQPSPPPSPGWPR